MIAQLINLPFHLIALDQRQKSLKFRFSGGDIFNLNYRSRLNLKGQKSADIRQRMPRRKLNTVDLSQTPG